MRKLLQAIANLAYGLNNNNRSAHHEMVFQKGRSRNALRKSNRELRKKSPAVCHFGQLHVLYKKKSLWDL